MWPPVRPSLRGEQPPEVGSSQLYQTNSSVVRMASTDHGRLRNYNQRAGSNSEPQSVNAYSEPFHVAERYSQSSVYAPYRERRLPARHFQFSGDARNHAGYPDTMRRMGNSDSGNTWTSMPYRAARPRGFLPEPTEFPAPHPTQRRLYNPNGPVELLGRPMQQLTGPNSQDFLEFRRQCLYLDRIAEQLIAETKMDEVETAQKKAFRKRVEGICQAAFHAAYPASVGEIFFRGFGSVESGFATKGCDIDLGVVFSSDFVQPSATFYRDLPRLTELALLHAGFGARLLTKTRVPVLKICETPRPDLYTALKAERDKWDELPDDQKYATQDVLDAPEAMADPIEDPVFTTTPLSSLLRLKSIKRSSYAAIESYCGLYSRLAYDCIKDGSLDVATARKYFLEGLDEKLARAVQEKLGLLANADFNLQIIRNTILSTIRELEPLAADQRDRRWKREKELGRLDFPKEGVGIQCDINFSDQLGHHNTALLRCYSLCDPRVAQVVLFVKTWAKRRQINSAYSGTLSSYGYVLMVLHYLMNIEHPPIIPNLQLEWPDHHSSEEVNGYTVKFLRDEKLIAQLCSQPWWKQNQSSVGILLRGFFRYYSGADPRSARHERFFWGRDVVSIRTQGGLLQKEWKGWTAAITVQKDQTSVRQRYLVAIEDPFEHEHNVARTVHQRGLDAIRDEFRRAWRIISNAGRGTEPAEGLCDELPSQRQTATASKVAGIIPQIGERANGGGATDGAEQTQGCLSAGLAGMNLSREPQADALNREPQTDASSREPQADALSGGQQEDDLSEEPQADGLSGEPQADAMSGD